jgi:hypothetical protein
MVDSFTLSGNINRDSGLVTLMPGGFYQIIRTAEFKPVSVSHGKLLSGNCSNIPFMYIWIFLQALKDILPTGVILNPELSTLNAMQILKEK